MSINLDVGVKANLEVRIDTHSVPASGLAANGAPRFDPAVPRNGYVWWYVDALSDDGLHGITVIAFIGSVFSPFYAWSRRRGMGDPYGHCTLNVALYGRPRRWTMTERRETALRRGVEQLSIGPSSLRWDGQSLVIDVDEVTAPLPSRVRGTVRVHPAALTGRTFELAPGHRWSPIAPVSRVEVALERPGLRWAGPGYLDSNEGDAALEDDFVDWDWCRAPSLSGATILYNARRRSGGEQSLALRADRRGAIDAFEPPPPFMLPPTRWRVPRPTRADAGTVGRIRGTLEDTPFYSRSVLDLQLGGERVAAVHESLWLDRFRAPWVQAMLPFRMPRRFW